MAPTRGQVLIGGADTATPDQRGTAHLRRKKLGIVFQQPNLLASLTALEQLLITDHLRKNDLKTRRSHATRLLNAVGLADHSNRRPDQLSGGQRQRVNIARALMGSPDVLLVDEPTSALDASAGHTIVELLATMTREYGTATIIVTHDVEHVPLCDREIAMRDGKLHEPVAGL
ncbi:ABC transporter ATP-binding protein [Arthrobacter sp. M4]|uniref:ABC transporter ATP-binding protein n=1 Tax=Arthrobacter sp. M4 TaxID=218160 RepID=UPI001CDB4979|nr:ATP-binding cassette domain-containing protein [Arthrobacter sp. M4]MCA4132499.1 ATP-binding cassette domain-containing protein [Arthrobacter sp. M4]